MNFINTSLAATVQNSTTRGTNEVRNLGDTLITSAPLWIIAIILFLSSFFIASIVKRLVVYRVSNSSRYSYSKEIILLIDRAVYFGIILLGLIAAFGIIGIDITAMLGFLGLGFGFAFKDLLANFIAGVVILTQKKFMIGDKIIINGILGKIKEIEARTTQVEDLDGTIHIIPNAQMLTSVVQNLTKNSFRRISFQVGVHYQTPLEYALKVSLASIKKHKDVVEKPESKILIREFGASAITLEIRFWIESLAPVGSIKSQIMNQLKKDYDEAGINIPYPMTTLSLDDTDKNILQAFHLPIQEKKYESPLVPPKKEHDIIEK